LPDVPINRVVEFTPRRLRCPELTVEIRRRRQPCSRFDASYKLKSSAQRMQPFVISTSFYSVRESPAIRRTSFGGG
jgi:hypothetical protein